MACWTLCSIFD